MSAAIQLVNPAAIEAETTDHQLGNIIDNVTLFEPAAEQKLPRVLSQISQLQAEVRALREELARAERAVQDRDVLLRNALVREMVLRAELVKGLY
jgi:hypothetical protein